MAEVQAARTAQAGVPAGARSRGSYRHIRLRVPRPARDAGLLRLLGRGHGVRRSRPTAVTQAGSNYDLTNTDFAFSGSYAYLAAGDKGLRALRIVSLPSITLAHPTTSGGDCSWAYDVEIVGDHAFVATSGSGLAILDLTKPPAESMISWWIGRNSSVHRVPEDDVTDPSDPHRDLLPDWQRSGTGRVRPLRLRGGRQWGTDGSRPAAVGGCPEPDSTARVGSGSGSG